MKILAFVDLHGSAKALKKLQQTVKRENPDILICAGDISIFEQNLDKIVGRISNLKKPVMMVQGNHEDERTLKKSCSRFSNMFFVHGRPVEKDKVLFIGWGGGGFSQTDKELEARFPEFEKKMKGYDKVVLITHAPPHKTELDRLIDVYVGNKSIRKFIVRNTEKIALVVCGHLHENAGKQDTINKTKIINPGPFGKIVTI